MLRPTTPTAIPIHASAESVLVTPTPGMSRRNGARNATTYVTTTSRVVDRSASPPFQLRASSPCRRRTSNKSHAPSSNPESQFVTRTHHARSGAISPRQATVISLALIGGSDRRRAPLPHGLYARERALRTSQHG